MGSLCFTNIYIILRNMINVHIPIIENIYINTINRKEKKKKPTNHQSTKKYNVVKMRSIIHRIQKANKQTVSALSPLSHRG